MQLTLPADLSNNPEFFRLYASFLEDVEKLRTRKNLYKCYLEDQESNDLILTSDYQSFRSWYAKKFSDAIPSLEVFTNEMSKLGKPYLTRGNHDVFSIFNKSHPIKGDYKTFVSWHTETFPGVAVPDFNEFSFTDIKKSLDVFATKNPYEIFSESHTGKGKTLSAYYYQFETWADQNFPGHKFGGIYDFMNEMTGYLDNLSPEKSGIYSMYIEENPINCKSMAENYERFTEWYITKYPGGIVPESKDFTLNYLQCKILDSEKLNVFLQYIAQFPERLLVNDDYQRFSIWHSDKFPGVKIPEFSVFVQGIFYEVFGKFTELTSEIIEKVNEKTNGMLKELTDTVETIRTVPDHKDIGKFMSAVQTLKKYSQ